VFSLLLIGCTSLKKGGDESTDQKGGIELLSQEIPPGKAILEFTTNTDEPAFLEMQKGNDLCNPDGKRMLARVRQKIKISETQDKVVAVVKALTFGLAPDPREDPTPATSYLYVDVDSDLILSPASGSRDYNGQAFITRTCGPLYTKFRPEQEAHYKMNFLTLKGGCGLTLKKIENDTEKNVKHSRWFCSKGFFRDEQ
jgi:hypothetical protein